MPTDHHALAVRKAARRLRSAEARVGALRSELDAAMLAAVDDGTPWSVLEREALVSAHTVNASLRRARGLPVGRR